MKTKILSAILVLLILISSLVSCTPTTPTDSTTTPQTTALTTESDREHVTNTETTPSAPSSLDLVKDGQSAFTVLRPAGSTNEFLDKLLSFIADFEAHTLVKLSISHEGRNDPPQNDNYEILIGENGRAETQQISAQLKSDDFFYGMVGNKIVILGGSDTATEMAMFAFLTNVVKKGAISDRSNITVTPDINCFDQKTYKLSGLTIDGIDAAPYKIVYSEDDFYGAYLFATRLSALIAKYSGYRVSVVNDKTDVSEHEIVVGNTNRQNLGSSDTAYTIACSNKKLYIHSPRSAGYEFVYKYFEETVKAASKTLNFAGDLSHTVQLSSVLVDGSDNMLQKKGSIRILFNNIWDVAKDDPTAPMKLRSQQLVDVYRDYAPDVIGLQEANGNVEKMIWTKMKKLGYLKAPCSPTNYTDSKYSNDNVIYYNPDTVTLIQSGSWLLMAGTDLSFEIPNWAWRVASYAVFEEKATGKQFCVVSLHYTWLENSSQAATCREFDAEGTLKLIQHLSSFNAPIILGGDYNARLNSSPLNILKNAGLSLVQEIAEKTDRTNTHHSYPVFDPQTGVCDTYYYPSGNNYNSLDHIYAYNASSVSFKLYEVVEDWFALASTDHCPLITDIVLN